jgi:hypothetical protein
LPGKERGPSKVLQRKGHWFARSEQQQKNRGRNRSVSGRDANVCPLRIGLSKGWMQYS